MQKRFLQRFILCLTFFGVSALAQGQLLITSDIKPNTYPYQLGEDTLVKNVEKNISFTLQNNSSSTATYSVKLFIIKGNNINVVFEDVLKMKAIESLSFNRKNEVSLGSKTGSTLGKYKLEMRYQKGSQLSNVTLSSPLVKESSNGSNTADLYVVAPFLKLNPSLVSLDYHGKDRATVSVQSNTAWKLKTAPNWLKINPIDTGLNVQITVEADNHNSAISRNGTVVLENETGIKKQIIVTQEPQPFISILTDSVFLGSNASDTAQVQINSNHKWRLSTTPTHLTLNPDSGSGNQILSIVTLEPNPLHRHRTHRTKIISNKGVHAYFWIIQRGSAPSLKTDKDTLFFERRENDSVKLNIQSNTDWSIDSLPKWLVTKSIKDSFNKTVYFYTTEENDSSNSKTSYFLLNHAGGYKRVYVTQKAGNTVGIKNKKGVHHFQLIAGSSLKLMSEDASQYAIISVSGQIVQQGKVIPGQNVIQLPSHLAGVYIFRTRYYSYNFFINR